MTDYVAEAIRTESSSFHAVRNTAVSSALQAYVDAAEELDRLKKAIFYGKNLTTFKVSDTELYNQPIPDRRPWQEPPLELLLNGQEARLFHAILGMATEVGELAQALINHLYLGKPLDTVNLIEEMGDVDWYKAIACSALNIPFEEPIERVIRKLRARYPDKFTEEQAINRDTAAERIILEQKGGVHWGLLQHTDAVSTTRLYLHDVYGARVPLPEPSQVRVSYVAPSADYDVVTDIVK